MSVCSASPPSHSRDLLWGIPPASPDDEAAWKWVSDPWIATDKAYSVATKEITTLNKRELDDYSSKCDEDLNANPSSRILTYKWALATWLSADTHIHWAKRAQRFYRVRAALQVLSPPYNYELARIRFLYISFFDNGRRVRPLGEALLKRNPQDFEVQFGQIKVLEGIYALHADPDVRSELIELGERLLADSPDASRAHGAKGSVYLSLWNANRTSRDLADKAIAEYTEYLRLAPSDDWFRRSAEKIIAQLRRG